ncbi:hypothetical protein PRIPAC_80705 [Pristionchus pacificus]|uniref:Uncharacterized protein n=1 Tax=Pristionchus pacificus TaxID=54126 RepID=A0A2A6CMY1_PRIPA|nr:hypothetical protein PRIPAC_80705 [Pristionchus pacificus]|eukprot:PDM79458.1 hypothetical protein PRIPAC_32037 [Pristionchus pacificus]
MFKFRMRFSVLFLAFVFLLNTVNIVVPFNVPPKGGLCFAAILGDCRRCECPRGRSCRKGKCSVRRRLTSASVNVAPPALAGSVAVHFFVLLSQVIVATSPG